MARSLCFAKSRSLSARSDRRMRAAALLVKLSVFGLMILACASCRSRSREGQGGSLESSEAPSVEDSGKRISGDFLLKDIEDDYGSKSLQGMPVSTFRFEESGAFKIERGMGAASSAEEGTYIIGKGNELVLYVEKTGGELRSGARVYRYIIADQGDDRMKLRANPSATLVLQRK
jgi:hypothetical protein